jgi:hypothetical protein
MRFCKKKLCLAVLSAGLAVLPLFAWELGETLNVQTLDGYFYPRAELMSVNDGGITICYVNLQNEPVLKGISFDRLPVELRIKFGYDPEKFAAYQKRAGTYTPPKQKNKQPATDSQDKDTPAQTATADQSSQPEKTQDEQPNLTVTSWDSYYYSAPRYVFRRYPVIRPPHRPGPAIRPRPPRPNVPHRPGPAIRPRPPRPNVPAGRPGR